MRPDVSAAFYRAVLEWARDKPPSLSDVLEGLDNVQDILGKSRVPTGSICSA
jgi:alpha-glucoside transport system substrate-binding protein